MMPTAVIIATAVHNAATSTEVRGREPARLREASSASTPRKCCKKREAVLIVASTNAGIAKTPAATASSAARYPKTGFPPMGGTQEAAAAASARLSAIHKPDVFATRTSNSRLPRAIASTGATLAASRAGDQAESRLTPAPTRSASAADHAVKAIVPGRLVT